MLEACNVFSCLVLLFKVFGERKKQKLTISLGMFSNLAS